MRESCRTNMLRRVQRPQTSAQMPITKDKCPKAPKRSRRAPKLSTRSTGCPAVVGPLQEPRFDPNPATPGRRPNFGRFCRIRPNFTPSPALAEMLADGLADGLAEVMLTSSNLGRTAQVCQTLADFGRFGSMPAVRPRLGERRPESVCAGQVSAKCVAQVGQRLAKPNLAELLEQSFDNFSAPFGQLRRSSERVASNCSETRR